MRIRDLDVLVLKKKIKNIHLSVLPTDGKVRVSVPEYISDETIRIFIIKKYNWIIKHKRAFQEQERQTIREYVSGESHYFKGKHYILRVEYAKRPRIEKKWEYIFYYVPKGYSLKQKQKYYEKWLRKELKKEFDVLVPKWENIIGVKAKEVRVREMKTRWGSCNPEAKRIWINLELIKKPAKLFEYVIVHELVHFLERRHNKDFEKNMDKYLPLWREYRRQLNEFIL